MFVATKHSDNTDHSTTAPTLKILSFSPLTPHLPLVRHTASTLCPCLLEPLGLSTPPSRGIAGGIVISWQQPITVVEALKPLSTDDHR